MKYSPKPWLLIIGDDSVNIISDGPVKIPIANCGYPHVGDNINNGKLLVNALDMYELLIYIRDLLFELKNSDSWNDEFDLTYIKKIDDIISKVER